MTNEQLFENFGSEKWVIEQNLCFMLQEYWDECRSQTNERMINLTNLPINPVSFVKNFMKSETYVATEYAEKSKMDTLSQNCVYTID